MDGLKLDTEKDEGKMIAAIVDMLSDVAETVADLEDVVDTISDELDCIEEDLDNIDDYLLDEDDEDEDDYEDYDDEDEDDAEDDEYDFGDDEVLYEVKCPTCGEEITIDEQMLDERLEDIKAACNATIEHGYTLQVGRYSKYKPTLHDYRSA